MFSTLGIDAMRHLARLIADGTLTTPFGDIALRREQLPTAVRSDLAPLASAGFTPTQIANVIGMLADERERCLANEARIELVATGPDGQAHARDTAIVVEQLFHEAQHDVLIVGFAVFDGHMVFKTIAGRMDEHPALRVVCCLDITRSVGDPASDHDIVDRYRRNFRRTIWPGTRMPSVYFDPRSLMEDRGIRAVLHAKTIVVDSAKALITSANPTPAAYRRNIELGVVITGGGIAQSIDEHFRNLIHTGRLQALHV